MSDSADLVAVCEGLVWGGNPRALREQPPIDPATWAGAVQHDLLQYGLDAKLPIPQQAFPAYLGAALIMMAKDEADIIGENLTWHYRMGFRRFVILDNGSRDSTTVILQRFQRSAEGAEVVILNDPTVRYLQGEKTTGLFHFAIALWNDLRWVFPLDADEFLVAQSGLSELARVPLSTDALSLNKVIHFIQGGLPYNLSSPLLNMPVRSPPFCVPPKVAVKNDFFNTISQGNHRTRLIDNRPPNHVGGLGYGLYIREFPTRSFDQFLRKIRNGGPAVRAAQAYLGRSVGGEHWLRYYEVLLQGGEEELLATFKRDWIRQPTDDFVVDPFHVDAAALL